MTRLFQEECLTGGGESGKSFRSWCSTNTGCLSLITWAISCTYGILLHYDLLCTGECTRLCWSIDFTISSNVNCIPSIHYYVRTNKQNSQFRRTHFFEGQNEDLAWQFIKANVVHRCAHQLPNYAWVLERGSVWSTLLWRTPCNYGLHHRWQGKLRMTSFD